MKTRAGGRAVDMLLFCCYAGHIVMVPLNLKNLHGHLLSSYVHLNIHLIYILNTTLQFSAEIKHDNY